MALKKGTISIPQLFFCLRHSCLSGKKKDRALSFEFVKPFLTQPVKERASEKSCGYIWFDRNMQQPLWRKDLSYLQDREDERHKEEGGGGLSVHLWFCPVRKRLAAHGTGINHALTELLWLMDKGLCGPFPKCSWRKGQTEHKDCVLTVHLLYGLSQAGTSWGIHTTAISLTRANQKVHLSVSFSGSSKAV